MEALFMLLVFAGLLGVGVSVNAVQRRCRRRFIEYFDFPAALRDKLRELHELSWADADRVLDGLREWFLGCHEARGEMIGMPSRAVDDAWHEFILMTRQYHEFCNSAFGRYLHHTPSAVSTEPVAPKIPTTLEVLERSGREGRGGALPALFTIDERLGIKNGRRWTRERIGALSVGSVGGFAATDCGDSDCDSGDGCGGCGSCCA